MSNRDIAVPTDVYDAEGNLLRIEFHTPTGEHIIDAEWDNTDEQTSENRIHFRSWAYRHLRNQDWDVAE